MLLALKPINGVSFPFYSSVLDGNSVILLLKLLRVTLQIIEDSSERQRDGGRGGVGLVNCEARSWIGCIFHRLCFTLFLWVYFHNCEEFLDNTYFVETPSAIPNGCPRNLRGAAGNYVIGEDWVYTE